MRRSSRLRAVLAAALLATLATPAAAQRFRPDDPVKVDRDDIPIPKPAEIELSTSHDVVYHSLGNRGEGHGRTARGINTLGEVPDSSWFTNRIGRRDMSLEELRRGPATTGGPDLSRPWEVIAGKSQGITPGFTIRDARGDVYFIKFDPVAWPHLSTSVDVIVSRFFHAFGYHVPENYLARFKRQDLRVGAEARFRRGRNRRPMRDTDLDEILALAPREPDGTWRVVASLAVTGEPIGHRLFFGVRPDDPNDIFPHEGRRDLRGYRVFSAWLNHDDSRALNSLDVWVPGGGGERGHVKHYLIDFSSALGSGSDAQRRIAPQNPRAGNEYITELRPLLKTLFSLGLWERPWRSVEYHLHPEIGRFEADPFHPERWKPEYPNPAFQRMLAADAFWATRIVARFDDEQIRALVGTGEYADPVASHRLADVIIARRDEILDHYLRQLAPLDEFAVSASRLDFVHLGARHGLGRVAGYSYRWAEFDNDSGARRRLGAEGRSETARVPIPESDAPFLVVRIVTESPDEPGWEQPVDIYLRATPDGHELVGLERAAADHTLPPG